MTFTGRCGSHREMSAVSCPISVGRLVLNELPSKLLRRPTTEEHTRRRVSWWKMDSAARAAGAARDGQVPLALTCG